MLGETARARARRRGRLDQRVRARRVIVEIVEQQAFANTEARKRSARSAAALDQCFSSRLAFGRVGIGRATRRATSLHVADCRAA